MQSNWPDQRDQRAPPTKRNERDEDRHGEDHYVPARRSEYDQGMDDYPTRQFERENRDYDRPAEPRRFPRDNQGHDSFEVRDQRGPPRSDDFQIKGRAVGERSDSPPRRGYVDHDAPGGYYGHGGSQPRFRDTRYDDRRNADRYSRGGHQGSREFYRDAYDPTVLQEPQQVVDVRNRGDGDVGEPSHPVRTLLVRGLKVGVSEAVFAKGMAKLESTDEDATGAPPGSLRSVMLIYDHNIGDKKSQGWGFAGYQDVASAQAALSRAMELGSSFTISSQVADVRMSHHAIFPRADSTTHQPEERFTFLLPETGVRHVYKDQRYFLKELMINASAPVCIEPVRSATHSTEDNQSGVSQEAKKKNKKKRAREGDQSGGGEKRAHIAPAFDEMANKWSAARKELAEEDDGSGKGLDAIKQPTTGVNAVALAPSKPQVQTFAHSTADKHSCWLCARNLKTADLLMAHLETSQLHAKNLKDETKIQDAERRLKSNGVKPEDCIHLDAPTTPSPPPTYVDRAALRREEEARTLPAVEKPKGFSLKNLKKTEQEVPPPSKGLGMMQRFGYKAGQGLGAEGSSGVTAPIAQEMYKTGVGLGHEKGKVGDAVEEAEKATKGGGPGYGDKVKESARERYEMLNKQ